MSDLFHPLPPGEGRFLSDALPAVSRTTPGARLQRLRVFREINEELAGPNRKYADVASQFGKERAIELYLRALVERGIRPQSVMGVTI